MLLFEDGELCACNWCCVVIHDFCPPASRSKSTTSISSDGLVSAPQAIEDKIPAPKLTVSLLHYIPQRLCICSGTLTKLRQSSADHRSAQ